MKRKVSKKNRLLKEARLLISIVFITILMTSMVGCKKGKNSSNTNDVNSNSNQTSGEKYYTKDLTKQEKENIITEIEKNETYELVDTYEVNKIIKDYDKSGSHTISIKINQLMKFKDTISNKGIILADMTYYGEYIIGTYTPNRPNIVDDKGNAIDTTTIIREPGYINNGKPEGLPHKYITISAVLSLGKEKRENNIMNTIYQTKTDVYQYYNVYNAEDIDLENLYIYYITNTASDKVKINNDSSVNKDKLYTAISLKTSSDSISPNINEYFNYDVATKNELGAVGNIYDKDGKTINKAYQVKSLLSDYKVEKWKDKEVLIVNYKFDIDEKEAYAYSNLDPYGKSFAFYLTDAHGKVYKPIKIADDKTLIKVSDGHQIVFILPDTFDGNEWYLTERTSGLYTLGERISVKQLNRIN